MPIIKESSANERPNASEVMRQPNALEGLIALGEQIHSVGAPAVERLLSRIGRQRQREIVSVGEAAPDKLDMAQIEDLDAGIDEGLEGAREISEHAAVLEERTDGRQSIIDELERAERDL